MSAVGIWGVFSWRLAALRLNLGMTRGLGGVLSANPAENSAKVDEDVELEPPESGLGTQVERIPRGKINRTWKIHLIKHFSTSAWSRQRFPPTHQPPIVKSLPTGESKKTGISPTVWQTRGLLTDSDFSDRHEVFWQIRSYLTDS